jgi:hypothetical protein
VFSFPQVRKFSKEENATLSFQAGDPVELGRRSEKLVDEKANGRIAKIKKQIKK